jgi:hypothetical protein
MGQVGRAYIQMKLLNKYNQWEQLSIVITLLFFISVFYYTYITAGCFVRSDDFRFINIFLKDFIYGTFDWKLLFQDHHPQPLSGLFFIINAKLFALNMNYTALFGTFFMLPTIFLIYIMFKDSSNGKSFNISSFFTFVLILFIYFSLNSSDKYNWSLVTLSNITLLCFMSLLYFINKLITHNDTHFYLIIGNTILLCLLDGNASKIFISSILLLLLILLFVKNNKKNIIYTMFILVAALILQTFFLNWVGFKQQYSEGLLLSLLNIVSVDFFALLKSFMLGLSNGLLNYDLLKELGVKEGYIHLLAVLTTSLYFYAMYIFFKYKYYERSIIPFILMIFSILFLLAVIVYRYPPIQFSPYMISAPRNTKFFEIGMIGMIWILGIHYTYVHEKIRINKILIIFTFILIVGTQLFYSYKQWSFGFYLNGINRNQIEIMKNYIDSNSTRPAEWIIGLDYNLDNDIKFLKEHNLNIFSSNCK